MKRKLSLGKRCRLLAAMLCLSLSFAGTAYAGVVNTPLASGAVVYTKPSVVIDASNTSQGYVMLNYTGSNHKVKVQITKNTTYTYDVRNTGGYVTFPLTEGSGTYAIKVFENVSGNSYAQAASQNISCSLVSELSPFLYPNQFCDFHAGSAAVKVAEDLAGGIQDGLGKVNAVYNYVVTNFTYDNQKAATVRSGYLPVVDATLASRTGICFDYAALMTSMLRSQGVPTKLVIGYAGDVYHAWVSVYVQGQGWIDNVIYFDGVNWRMMDPTFASSGKRSAEVQKYVSNPANYSAKYTY